MTLNIPWSDFPEEVKARIGPSTRVYLSHHDGTTVATASEPRLAFILRSSTRQPFAKVTESLDSQGIIYCHGQWSVQDDPAQSDYAVAAVAYVSNEETPGLWMEAFPYTPDVSDVIQRLMAEFQREGSIKDVSFDQFQSMAKPNVVILDHLEIKALLEHFQREIPTVPLTTEGAKETNLAADETSTERPPST